MNQLTTGSSSGPGQA